MASFIPHIIKDDSIVLTIKNATKVVRSDHPNFLKIRTALMKRDFDSIPTMIDIISSINALSGGKVEVRHGQVYYGGNVLNNVLTSRMLGMFREGFDIQPLIKFLENLMQNPSNRAVESLYSFLSKTNLPITEDGHFLSYKRVRKNFTDCRTGTFDNSPGKIVEMTRNMVDENPDRTCSHGLHVCSESYLPNFGSTDSHTDKVVICKVNPKDVVAIPRDYNDAKMRVCRYEVLDEYLKDAQKAPLEAAVFKTGSNVNEVKRGKTKQEQMAENEKDPVWAQKRYNAGYNAGKTDGSYGHTDRSKIHSNVFGTKAWSKSFLNGYKVGYSEAANKARSGIVTASINHMKSVVVSEGYAFGRDIVLNNQPLASSDRITNRLIEIWNCNNVQSTFDIRDDVLKAIRSDFEVAIQNGYKYGQTEKNRRAALAEKNAQLKLVDDLKNKILRGEDVTTAAMALDRLLKNRK